MMCENCSGRQSGYIVQGYDLCAGCAAKFERWYGVEQ